VLSETTAAESQHRSGGAAFWFRLTDNLFRRLGWWLLPVVGFTALGFVQAGNTIDQYRSSATLSAAENPLVGSPVVGAASAQWWETPAAATSRIINEQLRTDSFISTVAESAGLADAIEQRSHHARDRPSEHLVDARRRRHPVGQRHVGRPADELRARGGHHRRVPELHRRERSQ
jgi:hypothetical protein